MLKLKGNKKWLFIMALVMGTTLAACGGSSKDLAVTFNVASGDTIGTSKKLVATFTKSMDVDKVTLGGNMAGLSDGGVWSKTDHDNDTFTISPTSYWDASAPGKLTVSGKDKSGKTLEEVVLDFNIIIALSTYQKASIVIGQPDFISNSSNQGESIGDIGGKGISGPYGNPGFFEGTLYLPDYSNSRVLGYEGIPTANNASADFVIGQVDLTTSVDGTSATQMDGAQTTVASGGKLFVLEYSNNRVSIFNTPPTTSTPTIDVVVGQADFESDENDCTAINLNDPEGMFVADGKLVIADAYNHRVLIWNTIPTANGVAADIVLGQNSFTTCAANDDEQTGISNEPTARTLSEPSGVWTDGKKLVINDSNNNRTLIWNKFPTANFTPADIVLGQNDFEHGEYNDDDQDGNGDSKPSARTLDYPYNGIYSNGTQLFIADHYNNRVLIWSKFPTANFTPADIVLGQVDFEKYHENDDELSGDVSARTFRNPTGVLIVGNQLIVADESNARYLIFNGK